MLISGSN